MQDYTNRQLKELNAVKIENRDDGWVYVSTAEDTFFAFKPDRTDIQLAVGPFALETQGGSIVTGVAAHGIWLMHKSDADIERERNAFRDRRQATLRGQWERDRDHWRAREEALPEWIKPRLATFHEHGGEAFEIDGWRYELEIAELAALLRESDGDESSPSVREYMATFGTSANQLGFAKVLAAAPPEVGMHETISALTPLGSHPFYERAS